MPGGKERLDAAQRRAMMRTMSEMPPVEMPETLGVIAGRGSYPWQLARSAHAQGVKRVVAFAFRRETEWAIEKQADEVVWLHKGRLIRRGEPKAICKAYTDFLQVGDDAAIMEDL